MPAALLLGLVVAISLLAPLFSAYRYDKQNLDQTFRAPSSVHLLGTDHYGRDLLTRLAHGGRISLLVAFVTVLAETMVGVVLGGLAACAGGRMDELIMRLIDILFAFPALLLAILLAALLGPGLVSVIVALTLAGWPAMARTVRAEILSLREREYVEAARAQGAGWSRILGRHFLPNVLHIIVIRATLDIGPIILAEATLSFLGIGIQRPTPSWGVMIADSFQYLQSAPSLAIIPCAMLSATILALNFAGEGLAEALDPTLHGA